MATTDTGEGGAQEVEALRERVRALEAQVEQLQGSLDVHTESEERYRSLMDNAPVCVLVISSKGVVRYANLAVKRLTVAPEDSTVVGRSMGDLIHPDSKQSVAERMKEAFRTGVASEPVYQKYFGSTGEVIDAIAVGAPCTFEGEPAIQVVFVDITPQKRAEDAMRRSEAHFRALFEESSVGHVVLDTHGMLLRTNVQVSTLTGYTREELQQLSIRDLTDPDDLPAALREMKRLVAGESAGFRLDARICRKDGSSCWVNLSVRPLLEEQGPRQELIGSLVDLSDLKQAEDDLRRSEAFFRAIIEQSGEGMAIAGLDERYFLVNRALCEMTGYREEEFTRLSIRDLLPEGTTPKLFARVVDGEQGVAECEMVRKDGSRFPAEVSGYPLLVGDQQLALGIVRDVTERRRIEQERLALESQIQQAQKLESLGVLAGGIAHDFNNLLVGVLGNADLALHDLAPEAPARSSVQDIVVAAERAAELVRQMLAYAGRGRFVVEPIDLGAVVEEMTHLLQVSISKKATLRVDLARDLPLIEADVTQVRQVVMNLIINASDALADQSGVITVNTGVMECDLDYLQETYLDDSLTAGQYVHLEVTDTGAGMDEETVQRVFDPFFTTKFAGRGLGLAAVLGIVRGHRGAIKIYSEPGQGSTFKVLFPAAVTAHDATEQSAAGPAQTFSDCTILLVDDDEAVRLVGERMLRRLGCEVVTVCHGLEAVEVFRREPDRFTVVLLDLTMPRMDGDACFRELRRIRPDVRVILSSGYNEQELITRFAGKGLAGFIQKPYRLTTLSQKLTVALKRPE